MLSVLYSAVGQGLLWAMVTFGVFLTYRILDFADLSVDGTLAFGGAVAAVLTMAGWDPLLCVLAAAAAGAAAGALTALFATKMRIPAILSGILTQIALYSINLRIAGKANLPFFANATLFKNPFTKSLPAWIAPYSTLIIILLIVLAAKLLLDWYLKTKAGFLLRAAGDNASVVTTLARDVGTTKIIGLMIANALVALSGAVMAQHQRSFDISMGTGTMVTGLASVIIGTNLFKSLGWMKSTTMVIIGSVLYKLCVSAAISCGLEAQDMKLITAVLFLLILIFAQTQFKRKKVRIHA